MNNEKLEKIDFIHTKPSKLHPSIYVIFALVLGVIISNFFGIGYFLGILFGILAAALFTYLDYFLISRTLPCPYCNQKVKVKVDWRCDHCHKN